MLDYLRQKNIKIIFTDVPKHINLKLLRKAAHFYAATLLPKLRRKITITIRWSYRRKMTWAAEVEFYDAQPLRDFTVTMNGRKRGWMVFQAMGHEFVHIGQWVSGDMKEIDDHHVQWKGRKCPWDNDSLGYWDAPWELEAMGKEYGLYAKFKSKYNLKGKDLKAIKLGQIRK